MPLNFAQDKAVCLEDERQAMLVVSYSRVAGRADRCVQKKRWFLFGRLSGFAPAGPAKGGLGGHSPHDTGEQTRPKISFCPVIHLRMTIKSREHESTFGFLRSRAVLL